jgi:hypothetical protein
VPVAILGWLVAFGFAAAVTATRLERRGPLWFLFGAILGPIALALLRAAPPGNCRACGSPSRGWLMECWWCRQDVRGTSSRAATIIAGSPSVPANVTPPRADRRQATQPWRPYEITNHDRPFPPQSFGNNDPVAVVARPTMPIVGSPPPVTTRLVQPGARSTGVIATAVYVTGTSNLVPGGRYGIAIRDSRLQLLGPAEVDPTRIALDRPVAGMDARMVEGRLILGNPDGLTLAFMAVAGAVTGDLVSIIENAAGTQREP